MQKFLVPLNPAAFIYHKRLRGQSTISPFILLHTKIACFYYAACFYALMSPMLFNDLIEYMCWPKNRSAWQVTLQLVGAGCYCNACSKQTCGFQLIIYTSLANWFAMAAAQWRNLSASGRLSVEKWWLARHATSAICKWEYTLNVSAARNKWWECCSVLMVIIPFAVFRGTKEKM